ncbi:MAG: hypothetical protein BWY44_00137 [Candidatus Omnitrophica bacterium ADurb.Bin292]|nr:MAG: hypothetical protein BWY44_00137 [Candidatus Omnitrophica bacterium ADurb.Bin292]
MPTRHNVLSRFFKEQISFRFGGINSAKLVEIFAIKHEIFNAKSPYGGRPLVASGPYERFGSRFSILRRERLLQSSDQAFVLQSFQQLSVEVRSVKKPEKIRFELAHTTFDKNRLDPVCLRKITGQIINIFLGITLGVSVFDLDHHGRWRQIAAGLVLGRKPPGNVNLFNGSIFGRYRHFFQCGVDGYFSTAHSIPGMKDRRGLGDCREHKEAHDCQCNRSHKYKHSSVRP